MDMSLSKLWEMVKAREMVKDREDWHAAVHWGRKESDTTEQLDNNNKYSSDSVHFSGGFFGGSAVKT